MIIIVTTFLLVFLIRTILILRLIKLVRVLLDKNLTNFLLALPLMELILTIMTQLEELRHVLSELSVNELMELSNETTAEIRHRNDGRIRDNTRILDAEVRNLIDGVGDGYIPEDHYACERYYSTIDGVKNFRIYRAMNEQKEIFVLEVKILSPKGRLLPDEIKVRNQKYVIEFLKSKNYNPKMDY